MKTIAAFYKELLQDDSLAEGLIRALKEGRLAEFLKAQDCDASAEEALSFLTGPWEGELPDEALALAGGGYSPDEALLMEDLLRRAEDLRRQAEELRRREAGERDDHSQWMGAVRCD